MDELAAPIRERAMIGIKQKTQLEKGTNVDTMVETVSPALIEKVKALKSNMTLPAEERKMDQDSEAILKMIPTGDYMELEKDRPEYSSTVDSTEKPVKYTVFLSDETLAPEFNTDSAKDYSDDESTTTGQSPVTSVQEEATETSSIKKESVTAGSTEASKDVRSETADNFENTTPESIHISENVTTESSGESDDVTVDVSFTTSEPSEYSKADNVTEEYLTVMSLNNTKEEMNSMDESTTLSYDATTTGVNIISESLNSSSTESVENITESVQIETLSKDLLSKTKNVISENLQRIVDKVSLNESDVEEVEHTSVTTEQPTKETFLNLTTEYERETTTSPIIIDDYESVEMENDYTTSNKASSTDSTMDIVSEDGSTHKPEEEVNSTEEAVTSLPASNSSETSTDVASEMASDVTTVIINATSLTTSVDETTQYNLLGHLLNIHRNNLSDATTNEGRSTPKPVVLAEDLITLPTTETSSDVNVMQTTLSPIDQFLKLINDTFDLAERTNLTYPYYDTEDAPYDINAVQYATKSLADLISQTEKDFAASSQYVEPDYSLNSVDADSSLNSVNTDGTLNKIPYYHVEKDRLYHIGEERDVKAEGFDEKQKDLDEKKKEFDGEKKGFDGEKSITATEEENNEMKTAQSIEDNNSDTDSSSNVISSLDHYNNLYKKTREVLDRAYNERKHELFDKQFATSSTTTSTTTTTTSDYEDPVLSRIFKPKPEKPYDISDFQKYQKPADSLFMIQPQTPRPVRRETPRRQYRNPFVSYPEPSEWRIPQEGPYRSSVPQNQFYNPGYGRINTVKASDNWVKSGHNWYGMDSAVSGDNRNRLDQSSPIANLAALGIKQHTVLAEKRPSHSIYKSGGEFKSHFT